MQAALVLVAWFALTFLAVRPIRGRGIPVGRGVRRLYFLPRQAALVGSLLVTFGVALLAAAALGGGIDPALGGAALGWLGGLYLFHGLRSGT